MTFNPHVWGLFLQANIVTDVTAYFTNLLSIPMFGDSFCKLKVEKKSNFIEISFQSPCLGTLFASHQAASHNIPLFATTFNPHVWGLFLQVEVVDAMKYMLKPHFQSPCLGTLFASWSVDSGKWFVILNFQSPCLGTLFASYWAAHWQLPTLLDFQSPCLGTLFARLVFKRLRKCSLISFNPHVWGLFLQVLTHPELDLVERNFQSPCLGTLFARGMLEAVRVRWFELSIPMFGDSFCKLTGKKPGEVGEWQLSIPMFGDSFCKPLSAL